MGTPITVDTETIKMIAAAAAEASARAVVQDLKAETKSEFEQMERRIAERLEGYFGQLDASKHVVQHDRIERLLTLVDRMGEGIFASVVKNIIWGLLVAGVVGWLFWQKLTGGAG
jgi:hypothetical protein